MFQIKLPTNRPINQHFGEHPEKYMNYGLPGHEGVDFLCPWSEAEGGDPVKACAAGVVEEAGKLGSYGLRIILRHEIIDDREVTWVVRTIYAHLSVLWVRRGAEVRAGQAIGLSGNTGLTSEGPHLHLTMKVEGMGTAGYPKGIVDPEPCFTK